MGGFSIMTIIERLKIRQRQSEDFYLETYDAPKYIGKISGAEPMDNQSWEIGFYEGLQYAIDVAKEFGLVE